MFSSSSHTSAFINHIWGIFVLNYPWKRFRFCEVSACFLSSWAFYHHHHWKSVCSQSDSAFLFFCYKRHIRKQSGLKKKTTTDDSLGVWHKNDALILFHYFQWKSQFAESCRALPDIRGKNKVKSPFFLCVLEQK